MNVPPGMRMRQGGQTESDSGADGEIRAFRAIPFSADTGMNFRDR